MVIATCAVSSAEKDHRQGGRQQQRVRWLSSITDSTDLNLIKLQKIVEDTGA